MPQKTTFRMKKKCVKMPVFITSLKWLSLQDFKNYIPYYSDLGAHMDQICAALDLDVSK